MKTKKLLSIVMAVMMLFGCLGLNAFAIDWPTELKAGAAKFSGLAELSSVEIPVDAEFTAVASNADFKVYYSAEEKDAMVVVLTSDPVADIGVDNAYVANGVLHLNLKGKGLSAEGYYYISVAKGSLEYEGYYNLPATTEGVLYQFESLSIGDKIGSIFDFIIGIVMNLINNGKAY